MRLTFLSISLLPLFSAAASGQTATALLREGDNLAGVGVIDRLANSAVNQVGGYAVTAVADNGTNEVSIVWGNLAGGAGSVLRSEATIGFFEQTSYEFFFGISANSIAYSAFIDDPSAATNSDSVWLDDTLLMAEEAASSVPGEFWTFGSRPGVTNGGMPYFVGGLSTTAGGTTQRRGLFSGTTATPILLTGQAVPGLPFNLGASSVDFDIRFSAFGSNYITPIAMDTTATEDNALIVNGTGLMVGGTLAREDFPVPAAAGGMPGENWDRFDFCGITEGGSYFFTGDTDGNIDTDEFILRDGVITVREGDIVDGFEIDGLIEGAFLNETGALAYIWDVNDNGTMREALFLDDDLLLMEGDPVDWDGDGMIDANTALDDFTGTSSLTFGADGTIYIVADISVSGVEREALLSIQTGSSTVGENYCFTNPNSTGQTANISATGSNIAAANNVTLVASGMPAGEFGFFVNSTVQGFVANPGGSQGNLCVLGNLGRYNTTAEIFLSNPLGTGSLTLDLTMTPTATGVTQILAGQTWNFQAWYRDLNPGPASNFTQGLSITFN